MKRIFLIIFLLIALPRAYGETNNPKVIFGTANQEYKNGNYEKALETYKKINVPSPELYFNMGQCFYNLNRKGMALFYYTLANNLSPRDKHIKNTISKIKNELASSGAVINIPESIPIIDLFSLNEMFICLFILIIIIFTQAIINKINKKDRFWFYFICWTSVIFFSIAISISMLTNPSGYAVVTSSSAEVRQVQDITQSPFYTLPEGSGIKIITRENGWIMVNIKSEEGIKGWIPEKDILIF